MAFIRNTDRLIEGSSKLFFSNVRAKAAVQSDLDGLDVRLDVIEGNASVVGSIAKAQADAQAYADQQVAALVNSAPSVLDTLKELSDAIGGDASFAATVAGQIGAVDDKVDQEILDRQAGDSALDLRLDSLESDPVTKTYVDGIQSALDSRLDSLELDSVTQAYVDSADSALSGRLDVIEGSGEGSVEKAEQDAKDYTDEKIGDLEGQPDVATYVGQLASSVFGAISAEQSRAEGEEGLLDGRLDVIEGIGEGSVAKAEQDAKDYADGLDSAMDARVLVLESDPTTKSYVDGIQSALDSRLDSLESDPVTKTYVDGEIASTVASLEGQIEAEQLARESDVSGLDGRLDVLENDPVTKTYVDAEVLELDGLINSYNTDLDSRLDVLESDPVTKAYVDGEVSDLQGQITTEKGRIDAILSASEADKDSFAEIVTLINSVDTSNDSAFAGYVLSNDAAVEAVEDRLDVIEGIGEGSVAKAEQDAKDYADSLDSAMDSRVDALELDPVTKSYVDSADSTLQSNIDGLFASKTTSDLAEGTSLYYTQARFDSAFGAKSTSNLSEGSNLYYTQGRFDSAFAAKSSSDLAEGSKLFFTDARAKSAAVVNSSAGSQTDQAMSVSAAKSYIDTADNARLKLDGSAAMTGALNFSSTLTISQAGAAVISAAAGQMLVFTRGMRVPYSATAISATVPAPSAYISGVTSVSSPRTITLPAASAMGAGRMLVIKDETGQASSVNYIRIQPSGGQLIDGDAYYDIVVPYESVMIYTNGTNWFII